MNYNNKRTITYKGRNGMGGIASTRMWFLSEIMVYIFRFAKPKRNEQI